MQSQPPLPLIQRSDHNFHHLNFIRERGNRKTPSSFSNSSQASKYLPIIVCCFPLIVLDVLLTLIISQDWSLSLMPFHLYILTWERGSFARMYCQWEAETGFSYPVISILFSLHRLDFLFKLMNFINWAPHHTIHASLEYIHHFPPTHAILNPLI